MKKENLFPMPYTSVSDLLKDQEKLEIMMFNLYMNGFDGIECRDAVLHNLPTFIQVDFNRE